MIKSFCCKDTEGIFNDEKIPKFRNIENAARRKLEILNAATNLNELRSPPGNPLEALKGELELIKNGVFALFGLIIMLMKLKL